MFILTLLCFIKKATAPTATTKEAAAVASTFQRRDVRGREERRATATPLIAVATHGLFY